PLLWLLDRGAGEWGLSRWLMTAAVRDWFYHRARRPTGEAVRRLAKGGQKVVVIGDAATAGKSMPAIASAFEAALLAHDKHSSCGSVCRKPQFRRRNLY